jgi:hypothetical protein
VGPLSDSDDRVVKFYQNDFYPGGNSYYREIGFRDGALFPEDVYHLKQCARLDTVVQQQGFPLPDLIKIDVQGAEIDILKGATTTTINHAKYLIVELQHTEYNRGAWKADRSVPFIESLGWKCIGNRFSDNGPDADYCFERIAA